MSKEEIAMKLKKARENKKMKQEEVAAYLGTTIQKVSSFETGRTRVDVDTLARLCELYDVDVNYIIGIEQPERKPIITAKDRRDIAKEVEAIISGLESGAALSFDGNDDIDETTKELLRKSLENTLETARLIAKEKYTPNKYKK